MTTNDLSQCKNCIYHYTYNGNDMCKQVGDDFYLQWKVEDCPYHTTITSATKISDEIYRLRAENAALRERLSHSLELPYMEQTVSRNGTEDTVLYYMENGKLQQECFNNKFPEQLQARLAELKGEKK